MFGFDDSYCLFMYEAEGIVMVNTCTGCINTLVRKMQESPRWYVEENFNIMCEECVSEDSTAAEEDMVGEMYSRE